MINNMDCLVSLNSLVNGVPKNEHLAIGIQKESAMFVYPTNNVVIDLFFTKAQNAFHILLIQKVLEKIIVQMNNFKFFGTFFFMN